MDTTHTLTAHGYELLLDVLPEPLAELLEGGLVRGGAGLTGEAEVRAPQRVWAAVRSVLASHLANSDGDPAEVTLHRELEAVAMGLAVQPVADTGEVDARDDVASHTVELAENPTTGYRWVVTETSDTAAVTDAGYESDTPAGELRYGGGGRRRFEVRFTGAGHCSLELRRSFESPETPAVASHTITHTRPS